MKIRLAYGRDGIDLSLPDGLKVDTVEPRYVEAPADQAGALRHALRKPIGSPPLRDLVKPSDTVAIVCNDITRPTPYRTILPALLGELNGVRDDRIILFIATGTHRANTPDELRAMFGEQVAGKFRIVQNDAQDRDSHARVGTTARENDIWIHKEYLACDVRILTGFVEPHFFAGFSGGGKACMPGLALLDSILPNHSARNIDHAKATWGVTHGNPVWEEIREAALMTSPTFLLNVALDRQRLITAVFAGDMEQAHQRGCAFVGRHAIVPVRQRYDIVITANSGHPHDLNLYQSVKGMSAAARIVKNRGAIIVAAECRDGIPEYGQYKRLLFEAEGAGSLLDKIRGGGCSVQDAWQAQIHASICAKADVYLFSHNLTDEQIERAMLRPCRDIAQTVGQLRKRYGPGASVCVLPEGPQTISYVSTDCDSSRQKKRTKGAVDSCD